MGCLNVKENPKKNLTPDLVEFGFPKNLYTSIYPNPYTMKQLKKVPGIRLASVSYKIDARGVLCAIQLAFSNGDTSPMFEAEQVSPVELPIHTVQINPAAEITKVSMLIAENGCYIKGIRFYSGTDILIDFEWSNRDDISGCKWETRKIPKGSEIIGV